MEETGHFCVGWEGIVDGTKSLIWWQGWFRTWGGKDRVTVSWGEGGKWREGHLGGRQRARWFAIRFVKGQLGRLWVGEGRASLDSHQGCWLRKLLGSAARLGLRLLFPHPEWTRGTQETPNRLALSSDSPLRAPHTFPQMFPHYFQHIEGKGTEEEWELTF